MYIFFPSVNVRFGKMSLGGLEPDPKKYCCKMEQICKLLWTEEKTLCLKQVNPLQKQTNKKNPAKLFTAIQFLNFWENKEQSSIWLLEILNNLF